MRNKDLQRHIRLKDAQLSPAALAKKQRREQHGNELAQQYQPVIKKPRVIKAMR